MLLNKNLFHLKENTLWLIDFVDMNILRTPSSKMTVNHGTMTHRLAIFSKERGAASFRTVGMIEPELTL